ncbi:hypothetical protein F5887DRAFT_892503 [Amanita rubescens]|nr:hypothetical protein F5887DRAFT_892503 [Amanita rubescens]
MPACAVPCAGAGDPVYLAVVLECLAGEISGAGASVYLAAFLEYLPAAVLELAGNAARVNKKKPLPCGACDSLSARTVTRSVGQLSRRLAPLFLLLL